MSDDRLTGLLEEVESMLCQIGKIKPEQLARNRPGLVRCIDDLAAAWEEYVREEESDVSK